MIRKGTLVTLILLLFIPLAAVAATRSIPGINAKDAYPNACVDCHTKQGATDMKLSTLLATWNGKPDPKDLKAMQAFVPKGTVLKGKHPPITAAVKDIPNACMKCHAGKIAPPFAPLIHGIHLAPGDQSPFVAKFAGECTHCHKLNKNNGQWSTPSGSEK